MRIWQIMNRQFSFVERDDDLQDAFEFMEEHSLTELPVLEEGRIVGVLRAGALHDAAEHIGDFDEPPTGTIEDYMETQFARCMPSGFVSDAVELMDFQGSGMLYVVEHDGRLAGVLTLQDLMDWYHPEAEPEAGPEPETRAPFAHLYA